MKPKPYLRISLRTIISKFPDYCRSNLYTVIFLAIISFASVSFLGGCNNGGNNGGNKKKPRNIILVISDDVGAEQIPSYARELQSPIYSFDPAFLPNIQMLEDAGIRFRQAWSNPLCSPTRAGIYTGEYCCTHKIYSPSNISNGDILEPIPADGGYIPLPISMASSGYQKALFGKWHLGQGTTTGTGTTTDYDLPRADGFNHYAGSMGGELERYIKWTKVIDDVEQSPKITEHATLDLVSDAQEWINDKAIKQTPFFAVLAFNAPHWTGPQPGTWEHDELSPKCPAVVETTDFRPIYKGQLKCLDYKLGDLINFMKVNHPAVLDNTIIIFIGDNGTEYRVGEGPVIDGYDKGSLYQGGVHVPFIIADGHYLTKPEYRKATSATSVGFIATPGTTCDALIHTRDLYGTVRELAGIASPDAATESHSLVKFMTNPSTAGEEYVFTEGDSACNYAIRDAHYKLIRETKEVVRGVTYIVTEKFYKIDQFKWEDSNSLLSQGSQPSFVSLSSIMTAGLTTAESSAYTNLKEKLKSLSCYCTTTTH